MVLRKIVLSEHFGGIMRRLEHAAVELSGMNLIEASAGTGKTYAIASLYLRLLVEKELRKRVKVLEDEAGVKAYIITHIASGAYTADKFERDMQTNVNTLIRALVTEA